MFDELYELLYYDFDDFECHLNESDLLERWKKNLKNDETFCIDDLKS